MREIKFRAWDKKRKIIRDVWKISFIPDAYLTTKKLDSDEKFGFVHSYIEIPLANVELMQFTGLKDKNGVEIYEGDILKYNNEVCEVKWSEPEAAFLRGRNYMYQPETTTRFEVIGNIYENPELLKQI